MFGWIVIVADSVAGEPTPLAACNVKLAVPAAVGEPVTVPSEATCSPAGRAPAVTVTVGAGTPLAANWYVYG